MPIQHLQPGIDPTGLPGAVTKADLLQMWTAGRAIDTEGFVKWSQAAPDVVANPEYAFYIWMELDLDNIPTGNAYYYKGGAWVLFPTTNGAYLADNSVTLSKLKATGAAALDLIQRNAGNNGWQFVSPPNAIAANTLPVDKLTTPDSTFNYVLTSLLGVKAFTLITDLFASLLAGTLSILKLTPGAAKTFLRTKADGTATEWAAADISDLDAAGFSALQVARRNADNTGWIPYTPNSGAPSFLLPGAQVVVYNGSTVGWTTFSAATVLLTNKRAAILQVEVVWNTATDGDCQVFGRENNAAATLMIGRAGSTDAVGTVNQSCVPISVDWKFQYKVDTIVLGGGGLPSPQVKITLIGYYD